MSTLKIQAVEYNGRRLKEVGERLVTTFSHLFSNFVILDEIKLSREVKRLRYHFVTNPWTAKLPLDYRINFLLPNVAVSDDIPEILLKYGEPILGVTSLPAVFNHYQDFWAGLVPFNPNNMSLREQQIHGKAHNRRKSAYVSTHGEEFKEIDSESHLEVLTKTAIHELGHMFGLQHHFAKTLRDKLCPMVGGIFGEIVKYSSSADYLFCAECYRSLAVPEDGV